MLTSKLKSICYRFLPDKWIIQSGPQSKRTIYLTFDDGPHEGYTCEVLKILGDRNLKASFFVTGDHVKKYKTIFQDIITAGHDVYNHSYSHWEFEKFTPKDQIDDIAKLDLLLPKINTSRPTAFRPPRGRLKPSLLVRLIRSGRQIIYWSYDSMDYTQKSEEFLLERFDKKPVKSGDIILFHDDNSYTIKALPKLLDKWISAGYDICPVSELS